MSHPLIPTNPNPTFSFLLLQSKKSLIGHPPIGQSKIRGLSCGFFASSLFVADRFSGSILGSDLSASLNWFRGDGLSGGIFLKQVGCLL